MTAEFQVCFTLQEYARLVGQHQDWVTVKCRDLSRRQPDGSRVAVLGPNWVAKIDPKTPGIAPRWRFYWVGEGPVDCLASDPWPFGQRSK